MINTYDHAVVEVANDSSTAVYNALKSICIAGVTATGAGALLAQAHDIALNPNYSVESKSSESIFKNYFVDSASDTNYLDHKSYFSMLESSFLSAEKEGFVEIPADINSADDFYNWLHGE